MTYQPTICVITPTIGRATLRRTLESGTIGEKDRWIVKADGLQPISRAIWQQLSVSYVDYYEVLTNDGLPSSYGNSLRDLAMKQSDNDYFVFLDDDDIFVPNGIEIIKQEIARHDPPRPILFRMINGNGETLWRNREVTPGNVGGSMFVCPNIPGKLGTWANGHGHRSDFEFIWGTLEKYGPGWRQEIVWSSDVIIHCRPGDSND